MEQSTKTQPVTDARRTTPAPFASLACGIGGHVYRVVLKNAQPIALECSRCGATWKTERIEQADGCGEMATRQAQRRTITDDLLREVAEVYRNNLDSNPTQAVAEHFGKAHRTAGLWVQRAREAGYLGKASKGKAEG